MRAFRELVWDFYRVHGRDLPWRSVVTPYGVFVSEIMLQQTQVGRVLTMYPKFLERFGSFEALAGAPVNEVLLAWQGMGYNRRALWLQRAAQIVVEDFGGVLPRDPVVLERLPGIGANTAGSVAAFAYDVPVVFIETNIRRVFIHHFEELAGDHNSLGKGGDVFSGRRTLSSYSVGAVSEPALAGEESLPDGAPPSTISDKELRPLIEAALDRERPREWYWALMDYGADLAKRVPNPNRRSKHYAVQSRFEGSVRQLRGEVLRRLLERPLTEDELEISDARLPEVLVALEREGFVRREGEKLSI